MRLKTSQNPPKTSPKLSKTMEIHWFLYVFAISAILLKNCIFSLSKRPKMWSRGSKMLPRDSQSEPKRPQRAPQGSQIEPKNPKSELKRTKYQPQMPKVCPRDPKTIPAGFNPPLPTSKIYLKIIKKAATCSNMQPASNQVQGRGPAAGAKP